MADRTIQELELIARARARAAQQAQAAPEAGLAELQSMPTQERLQAVLDRGLDPATVARQQAIDTAVARREGIAEDTRDYRQRTADNYEPLRLAAAVHGAAQGGTFGAADEIMGGVGGLIGAIRPDQTMREGYEQARDRSRGMLDASRETYPGTAMAGELAGAVALPLPGAQALSSGGTFARMGKGAIAGAGLGGLYGFNAGEGGMGDRIDNAASTATIGGIAGGAAPGVLALGGLALDTASQPVRNVADRLMNRGSAARAGRAVARTLDRSGRSIDDVQAALVQAAQEGQDVYRLADALGTPGQRQLSGLVRSGGEGAEEVAQFLQQRQVDQSDRMSRFVSEAFDGAETAAQRQARLTAERTATANQAYGAARGNAAPVDVRVALSVIDDRIGGMRGSGVAGDSIDGRLASFRSRLGAETADGSIELSDFNRVLGVKQDVQDAIEVARRAGRNNEARELGRLSAALDEALEASSEGYRAANDGFRIATRAIDAIDEGTAMSRPAMRPDDVADQFSRMTPDQQASARVGYGNEMLRRIEGTGREGSNRAAPMTTTKARQDIGQIANNPDLMLRRVSRENDMFETRARALGGSRTADNLADIGEVDAATAGVVGQLAQGRPLAAAMEVAQSGATALFGESPQTRQMIVDALMSGDTSLLRKGMQSEGLSAARQAIIENLVRRMTPALAAQ